MLKRSSFHGVTSDERFLPQQTRFEQGYLNKNNKRNIRNWISIY